MIDRALVAYLRNGKGIGACMWRNAGTLTLDPPWIGVSVNVVWRSCMTRVVHVGHITRQSPLPLPLLPRARAKYRSHGTAHLMIQTTSNQVRCINQRSRLSSYAKRAHRVALLR